MTVKGLLSALGPALSKGSVSKGAPPAEATEPTSEEKDEAEGSSVEDFARVAFDAFKNNDEDQWVEAIAKAIRAGRGVASTKE